MAQVAGLMGAGIRSKAQMMVAVIGIRRLALVTFAILLPVILGTIVVLAVTEDRQHAVMREAQHHLVHGAVDRLERDLDRKLSAWLLHIQQSDLLGAGLSESGAAGPRLAERFARLADSNLLGRGSWKALSLHDLSGEAMLSSAASQSVTGMLKETRDAWRLPLEAGNSWLISLRNQVGSETVVAYLIPLLHNEQTLGVLVLQYDAAQLESILARTLPNEVGQRLLLDRDGKVLANSWVGSEKLRAPPHDLRVGDVAPPELLKAISWGELASMDGTYPDGRRFHLAFSPLRFSEWMVVVSVPCQGLFGEFLRNPGSLHLIMAFSLLAAALIGGILVFAVVGRNTAEQRLRVLEAEKEADRRLTELAANFPGLVFRRVLLPDGRLTYPLLAGQDDLLVSLIGRFFRDGKLAPEDLQDLIRPDGPDGLGLENWQAELRRTAATLEPLQTSFSVVDDLGRRRHYRTQSNAWREADGSVIWDGVVMDTTDVQEAEQARAEGEQRLAVALKAAQAGLWDWDLTSGKCVWTENMWPLFGQPHLAIEPDLGVLTGLVVPEDRQRVTAEMRAAIEGCGTFDTEFRVASHGGEIRWLYASARCFGRADAGPDCVTVNGSSPKAERMTGILIDVTERVRTASLLKEAKEEAERANVAKSKFLAAASHDLRQPVQSLLLYIHVLEERLAGDPSHDLVISMQDALDALKSLLDTVLDLSKLDAGAIIPEQQVFAISTLLERIGGSYAPRYTAKGLSLRVLPGKCLVRSDPVLLGRILANLVENALTYTASGGVVVGCRRRGDTLRIEVWDSGIGIPLDRQQEIFEEFVQIRSGHSAEQAGLGLGLAIVSRLSRLLGHEISLRSVPGRGSCFAVTVPLGKSVPVDGGDGRAEPDRPGGRGLVLVIKDDKKAVDALQMRLSGWGYEVVSATTAAEALARLAAGKRRPDVVISNPHLIRSNGGLVDLQRLRQEYGPDLPGIILTGDADPDLRSQAESLGLSVLLKPVSPDSLLRELRSVMLATRSLV